MTKGDLVHIPQDAFLLREIDEIRLPDAFLRPTRPLKALFWDKDQKDKNHIWSIRMKDIYPISQEVENAS